jgi:hypothetical protein
LENNNFMLDGHIYVNIAGNVDSRKST